MPLSFWKLSIDPPRRDREVGAFQLHGPHAVQKGAQLADLRPRQFLHLLQFSRARLEVALQQLAHDLQPHLQADEALQRPIVEIGGDPLPLVLARELSLRLGRAGRGRKLFQPPLQRALW